MSALGEEIPKQEIKMAIKEALNNIEGVTALPMNTSSESEDDRVKVDWKGRESFMINIVPVEVEDGEDVSEDDYEAIKVAVSLPDESTLKDRAKTDDIAKNALAIKQKGSNSLRKFK